MVADNLVAAETPAVVGQLVAATTLVALPDIFVLPQIAFCELLQL